MATTTEMIIVELGAPRRTNFRELIATQMEQGSVTVLELGCCQRGRTRTRRMGERKAHEKVAQPLVVVNMMAGRGAGSQEKCGCDSLSGSARGAGSGGGGE